MPALDAKVENALSRCGQGRVFHNDGTPPSVAVRWSDVKVPPEERWIVQHGENHSEAGRKAATEFANRIRSEGERLILWADRIMGALK